MSYRLLLLALTKNNCSRRTANGENESEKENSTIRLWFFHDVKFCRINCFIFVCEAPSRIDTVIWTFNAIKDSLNDRKGRLGKFSSWNMKIFPSLSTQNTHLRWDGKLITAKVRFRLDGCSSSLNVALGKSAMAMETRRMRRLESWTGSEQAKPAADHFEKYFQVAVLCNIKCREGV